MFNSVSPLILQGSTPFRPPENLWMVFAAYEDGEVYWELHTTRDGARKQLKRWKENSIDSPTNAGYCKISLLYNTTESGIWPWGWAGR